MVRGFDSSPVPVLILAFFRLDSLDRTSTSLISFVLKYMRGWHTCQTICRPSITADDSRLDREAQNPQASEPEPEHHAAFTVSFVAEEKDFPFPSGQDYAM
jgi:hypothetical protein